MWDEIEKKYKILTLGELEEVVGYPTGAANLDRALGVGGIPGGRVTEIYGPESSGKTSLVQSVIARLHENTDESALYIDAENAIEKNFALATGIDRDRLKIIFPEVGEDVFIIAEAGIRSGLFAVVVVDSVPAISPRKEMENEIGDAHVGLTPRLVSQFLRKTAFAIRESEVAVIFCNQLRDRISRVPLPPESPGGRALKHHTSVRIYLRNSGPVKMGEEVVGSKIEFTVKKNKVGAPYGIGAFEIWNDRGVCTQASLLDEAVRLGVVQQKGAWFSYNDGNVGQGRSNAIQALTDNVELAREIKGKINGKT